MPSNVSEQRRQTAQLSRWSSRTGTTGAPCSPCRSALSRPGTNPPPGVPIGQPRSCQTQRQNGGSPHAGGRESEITMGLRRTFIPSLVALLRHNLRGATRSITRKRDARLSLRRASRINGSSACSRFPSIAAPPRPAASRNNCRPFCSRTCRPLPLRASVRPSE